MKGLRLTLSVLLAIFIVACSTSKNIPEGKYLLDKVEIKHDTHNATSDLELFLKQHPNSSLPLLGKVRLKLYNSASPDTTKWFPNLVRKLGQKPEIYNPKKTALSMQQLLKEAQNQGYLNAKIDTSLKIKENKIAVTYSLKGDTPYKVRNYEYQISDTSMAKLMKLVPLKPAIEIGSYFDQSLLEQERERVSMIMRNAGYYSFSKELAYFKADTTLDSHQVDLFLNIYPNRDSVPYHVVRFNHITVVSGINEREATNLVQGVKNERKGRRGRHGGYISRADTTEYKGVTIIRGKNKFLRNSSIYKNLYIKSGRRYADMSLSRTHEAFSKMGAVKQVNISTAPSKEDSIHGLDATILLTPANVHWFRAGLEGTNSAGDIGIAPSLGYQHQNIFNGSEQFSINLKGAYEFITGNKSGDLLNKNYYEYGIETSLAFPQFLVPFLKKEWREMPSAMTKFSIGYNKQHRNEYTREFFNFTTNYNWRSNYNRFMHGVDLFDVTYIKMANISHRFDSIYLQNPKNPMLRESYKNQLIARTSYTFTMVNGYRFNPLAPTFTFKASAEVSGVLPRLVSSISKTKKDNDGQRKMLGVAYAEYMKFNFDYARALYFSKQHSVAFHANLGIAHPYGNSGILPFERRFFSGGANSVRGWSTRRLGPGSYRPKKGEKGDNSEFVNQVGDFKLEFNVENRMKFGEFLEIAQFIDVGNIWTLKNYQSQPRGQFKLNRFYKELAAAYGLGLRFDLSFLLLRLDWGLRIYDPAMETGKFVMFKPRSSRMALHFGIGYPF